ncbi:hypothetical protein D3C86_2217910 [compost metagenome]
MGRLDQRAVDVHQAEQLQQHHQWQAQREVADIGAERGVEHRQRPQSELAEGGIEDTVVAQKHLP